MKNLFEKVSNCFVSFMSLIGIIMILGVIVSPIYMPIMISTITKNNTLSWFIFVLCVAVAITLVIVLVLIYKKNNEKEATMRYNNKYHRSRVSQNSYLED